MSRLYFNFIILLVVGILVFGISITANSIEYLEGKPITVLAINRESGHTRISLLGTEYDMTLSKIKNMTLPAHFNLENGLNRVVLWCQELKESYNLTILY